MTDLDKLIASFDTLIADAKEALKAAKTNRRNARRRALAARARGEFQ